MRHLSKMVVQKIITLNELSISYEDKTSRLDGNLYRDDMKALLQFMGKILENSLASHYYDLFVHEIYISAFSNVYVLGQYTP